MLIDATKIQDFCLKSQYRKKICHEKDALLLHLPTLAYLHIRNLMSASSVLN